MDGGAGLWGLSSVSLSLKTKTLRMRSQVKDQASSLIPAHGCGLTWHHVGLHQKGGAQLVPAQCGGSEEAGCLTLDRTLWQTLAVRRENTPEAGRG